MVLHRPSACSCEAVESRQSRGVPAACGIFRCERACGRRGRRRGRLWPLEAAGWVGRAGPRRWSVGERTFIHCSQAGLPFYLSPAPPSAGTQASQGALRAALQAGGLKIKSRCSLALCAHAYTECDGPDRLHARMHQRPIRPMLQCTGWQLPSVMLLSSGLARQPGT